MKSDLEVELGEQPLHELMQDYQMSNHAIVAACGEQLSHKVVNKARSGRRISRHLQRKVLKGFNLAGYDLDDAFYERKIEELFNY